MFSGIRTRLLALVLVATGPFVVLIALGLRHQWSADQAQASRDATVEAQRLASQVDDQINILENVLTGLGHALSGDAADAEHNDIILRRVRAEVPAYVSNILLFGLDGANIGTSWELDGGRFSAADRDYFRRILAGHRLAVGPPARGRITGDWVIGLARPVEDTRGRLRAVLVVGITLERFQDALHVGHLPEGSIVQIANETGIVVARNIDPEHWIGETVSRREHLAGTADPSLLWRDGVERLTAVALTGRVPWIVQVGVPSDAAFARVVSRLEWSAAASAVALMVALALAWTLSGRIVRPLRQLARDAAALAAGDLAHRSAVGTSDEVGALASAFNAMAASLESRHRDLDQARAQAAAEALLRTGLEEQERKAKETLAAVIDASPVAIVCSDRDRKIVLWSRAAEQTFGYSSHETIGHRTKILPPEAAAQSAELFARAIGGETLREVEVKRLHKDGTLVDIRLAASPMYDGEGNIWGVAWEYEDITDRKKVERQLVHLAHFDQLTGLPNRITLREQLSALLDAGRAAAVALFDLDGFKDVNDTVGHSTGDGLLIAAAQRLGEIAGERGAVYRLGGDEFVLVIPDCGDPRPVVETVSAMMARIAEPFAVHDHTLHVGASAGVAMAPADGATVDEVIANADLALYKAKAEGGRTYRLFIPAYRARAQSLRGLDLELRHAFAANEFELYFQPQVRLADNAVVGAEALLRWRHPVHGVLGPASFIDALSASALAPAVGRWILHEACARTAEWGAQGLPLRRIGVNLFPVQARSPSLPTVVDEVLRETGLPPAMLELEITEHIALNHDDAIGPLQKLAARGVGLAFDDFGTGYASLSYLTRVPVSRIKIDRAFIAKVTEDGEHAAIVRSLVAMAHNLGLSIIAEGVETPDQAAFLKAESCEEAQGFLFGKPMSAADFEAYLTNNRPSLHLVAADDDARGLPSGRRRSRA